MRNKPTIIVAVLCLVVGLLLGILGGRGCSKSDDDARSETAPVQAARSQLEVMNDFHRLVYDSLEWDKTTWLGIHAQQNPNDVWSIQQIFNDVKPDFVVEAGTNHGGGALVWATLLAPINPKGKVLTIDIEDKHAEAAKLPLFKEKVEFFLGSSTSEPIVKAIRARVKDGKAIVILDSDHSKEHVSNEIELYADLVSVGSYLLVQDTNIHGHPVDKFGPGPWEAVEAFMAEGGRSKGGATFEIDRSREILFFSMHPTGYLKRVK
jgi:cephalosporin hydroxylase